MPAHIKTMVTSCSLQIPVIDGAMALGTWQGIYLIEHRARPHRREVVMQFVGSRLVTAEQRPNFQSVMTIAQNVR